MYDTPNSLLRAARELNIPPERFKLAAPNRWKKLFHKILATFADGCAGSEPWLWEHFSEAVRSANLPSPMDVLRHMSAASDPVWLLVKDWHHTKREGKYWLFVTDLGAATDTLENHHAWLVAENHHGILMAIGALPVDALQAELSRIAANSPSAELALRSLHEAGASPVEAIKALHDGRGMSLSEAKSALHVSSSWEAEARAAEAIWDDICEHLPVED